VLGSLVAIRRQTGLSNRQTFVCSP